MNKTIPILTGAAILIVLTLFNTTYTVNYHEVAVATRFGKPAGVVRDPGLHFKAPFFIDGVSKLDTRLQLSESNLETVLTKDGQQVVVKAFLLWRVDPKSDAALDFFTSYGTIDAASKELETRLNASIRGAVGQFAFTDLIGANSRLPDAEQSILADLKRKVAHAKTLRGTRFITLLIPCLDGWGLADDAGLSAARLAVPLGRWKRFDAVRGSLMQAELQRIAGTAGASKDVLEMATRALA